MADTDITPALNAEEWESAKTGDHSVSAILEHLESEDMAPIIAWANARMSSGDPRKITRADVEACLAAGPRTWNDPIHGEPPEALARLAAKLAALLPLD